MNYSKFFTSNSISIKYSNLFFIAIKSITPLKVCKSLSDQMNGTSQHSSQYTSQHTSQQMINSKEISSFDVKQHNINQNNANQRLSTSLQNNRNQFKNDYNNTKALDDLTGKNTE